MEGGEGEEGRDIRKLRTNRRVTEVCRHAHELAEPSSVLNSAIVIQASVMLIIIQQNFMPTVPLHHQIPVTSKHTNNIIIIYELEVIGIAPTGKRPHP